MNQFINDGVYFTSTKVRFILKVVYLFINYVNFCCIFTFCIKYLGSLFFSLRFWIHLRSMGVTWTWLEPQQKIYIFDIQSCCQPLLYWDKHWTNWFSFSEDIPPLRKTFSLFFLWINTMQALQTGTMINLLKASYILSRLCVFINDVFVHSTIVRNIMWKLNYFGMNHFRYRYYVVFM